MNRRRSKIIKLGSSLAVILPKDWTRGMDIEQGQLVELVYNGEVRIVPIKEDE